MDTTGGGGGAASPAHMGAAAGTTNEKKRPGIMTGGWTVTKKYKNAAAQGGGTTAVPTTTTSSRPRNKRPFEYGDGESRIDVSMTKLYKCNYWEDPDRRNQFRLQFFGLSLARNAALDNLVERMSTEAGFRRELEAWTAAEEELEAYARSTSTQQQ